MRISDWGSDVCSSDLVGFDPVDEALDRKAERGQRRLQHIEHRAGRGGDAGRGDQRLRKVERVDAVGHAASLTPSRRVKSRLCIAPSLCETKEEQRKRLQCPSSTSIRFRSEEHTSELQSLMRTSYAVS